MSDEEAPAPLYRVIAWRAKTAQAAAFKAELEAAGHVNMIPPVGDQPRRFSATAAVFAVCVPVDVEIEAPVGFEIVDESLAMQFAGF